jgi:hypothetical protein
MIYLAVPYTHEDEKVRIERFEAVNRFAAFLVDSGEFVYSPISHCHPIISVSDLSTGWEYWKAYDEMMIGHCSELFVLCLEGWRKSIGVNAEIEIAKKLGLQVRYFAEFNYGQFFSF